MAIKREYDLVMPMGMNCIPASQLKKRGLRHASYPFDWLLTNEDNGCETIASLIITHFKDFLKREHLIFDGRQAAGRHVVVDQIQKLTFWHDFFSPSFEDGALEAVQKKYWRRIDRFYQMMQTATKVCVVMAADANALDVDRLKTFHETIVRHFPNLEVLDLFAVIFGDKTYGDEECMVTRGTLYVKHLLRLRNPYDLTEKVHDFIWLDEIGLSNLFAAERSKGKVSRKMNLWERLHYKVYRHSHKWLERHGLLRTDYDV